MENICRTIAMKSQVHLSRSHEFGQFIDTKNVRIAVVFKTLGNSGGSLGAVAFVFCQLLFPNDALYLKKCRAKEPPPCRTPDQESEVSVVAQKNKSLKCSRKTGQVV
jgi:hypothetical protein